MKPILGILGATGVGKSAVAVEVAKILHGEVISCDSAQVFHQLNIGTAKITFEEMEGIAHYMLDVKQPNEQFSAYDYQNTVVSKVFPKFEKDGLVPVVAGGTGLYYNSLIYGLDFPSEDSKQLRADLKLMLQTEGLNALQNLLQKLDAKTFEKIDKNNPVRLMRAIEIASGGGSMYGQKKIRKERFKNILFILKRSREDTYKNINLRVDKMVSEGLFDEVYNLYNAYKDAGLQSLQAIGYKEAVCFLEGKCSKEKAIEEIKLNTRHYAKRQETYFKGMKGMYVETEQFANTQEIAQYIADEYQKYYKSMILLQ